MSKWSHPPIIKIYEALGSVADGRIEIDGNSAKVYSSSGNKFYTVNYDPEKRAIMTNDNGSFWKGYLGYPAIAFLLKKGILSYEQDVAKILANIKWKDINQKFKNDFDKTLEFILAPLGVVQKDSLNNLVQKIDKEIAELNLSLLGNKIKPPEGY